jgi:CheY-like chemotaxis protein
MQSITTKIDAPIESIDLSLLARRAGIPHPTWISVELAKFYGLTAGTPFQDRSELHDLVWSVASALCECLKTRSLVTPTQKLYWIDYYSYLPGVVEPKEISIVATLHAPNTEHTSLYLSLATEKIQSPPLVLVVEDDEQVRRAIQIVLQRVGLAVIAVGTGGEAFRATEDEKPDVILLDVDLPDMSGFEILRFLKANPKLSFIPVIFCTGRLGMKEELIALGAVDCLEKPQDIPRLATCVTHWLGQPSTFSPGSEKTPN